MVESDFGLLGAPEYGQPWPAKAGKGRSQLASWPQLANWRQVAPSVNHAKAPSGQLAPAGPQIAKWLPSVKHAKAPSGDNWQKLLKNTFLD